MYPHGIPPLERGNGRQVLTFAVSAAELFGKKLSELNSNHDREPVDTCLRAILVEADNAVSAGPPVVNLVELRQQVVTTNGVDGGNHLWHQAFTKATARAIQLAAPHPDSQ